MLDHAHGRLIEELSIPRRTIFVTAGPAGLLASDHPCEAVGLDLYLLLPKTSDHLFNLEHDPCVTLLTARWELKGKARPISPASLDHELSLLKEPGAEWCCLVLVKPYHIQISRETGWGYLETIDLESHK